MDVEGTIPSSLGMIKGMNFSGRGIEEFFIDLGASLERQSEK